MNIEPSLILGLSGFMKEEGEGKERKLSKEEIIAVQEVLLNRLQSQLLEK